MDGVEVFEYGETVRDLLPAFFRQFLNRSSEIDFGVRLHPLWTALEGVLDDRLALASVSLERTASTWDDCRDGVLSAPFVSDASFWKKKAFLRGVRNQLQTVLENMVKNEYCQSLTQVDRNELYEVLKARIINNLTGIPNSAQLRRPFEDLKVKLNQSDQEALQKRNEALHGGKTANGSDLTQLELSAQYFDSIRMLLTKFVLAVCDYKGPYIDYASRPEKGNFEVVNMGDAIVKD
ncbi:MAG: hypothetical protein JWM11_3338 [Planctomycetaceae bacterium]|nr:hypothetical protein [Planctomycetaceae bacterium]